MENYLLSSPTQLSQPYDYDENFDFLQNLYQPIDPQAQLQQFQNQQLQQLQTQQQFQQLQTQQQFQQLYQHQQQQYYQDQQQQSQQQPQQQQLTQPQFQQQNNQQQQQSDLYEEGPEDLTISQFEDELQDPYFESQWSIPKSKSLNFESINKSLLATPSVFRHKSSNSVTSITHEPPSTSPSMRSYTSPRITKTPRTPSRNRSLSFTPRISLDAFLSNQQFFTPKKSSIDLLNLTNCSPNPGLHTPITKPVLPRDASALSPPLQNPPPSLQHYQEPLTVITGGDTDQFSCMSVPISQALTSITPPPQAQSQQQPQPQQSFSPPKEMPPVSPVKRASKTLSSASAASSVSSTSSSTSSTSSSSSSSTSLDPGANKPSTTIEIPPGLVITKTKVRNNRSMQSREDLNKKFECPICKSRFQRPEHVKRHLKSHTSEKPFQCTECQKRFNRKDNLKAHLKKIHKFD
ncbi:hypothetical protein G210_1179, partial [Candida maltosa Xu316]